MRCVICNSVYKPIYEMDICMSCEDVITEAVASFTQDDTEQTDGTLPEQLELPLEVPLCSIKDLSNGGRKNTTYTEDNIDDWYFT